MAPRKMKNQVALKPKFEKNMKVRVQVKRMKAEIGKTTDDQNCTRDKQEIERQCHQHKEETEIIMKQTVRTQVKVVLMFKILKAREGGDFLQAAMLTHFLREFVAKERASASLLAQVKNENP